LTAMKGSPRPSAIALPVITPTMSPPISPGPEAAATPPNPSKTRPPPAAPRPGGGRASVKGIEMEARLGERLLDRHIEQLDMGARSDLRHDATISRMQVELRAHHARQDLAATIGGAAHDSGRGLVAARLDAERGQGHVCGRWCHDAS